MLRSEYVASREDSLLLIIDFQQAMLKAIDSWGIIARNVNQLTHTANTLGVPVLVTEQYKKGLGDTSPEVLQEIKSPIVFQKEHFSA